MNKLLIVMALLSLSASIYAANDVINTKTQNTVSQDTVITSTVLGNPKDWDLTLTEWARYNELMQGPAKYYYSKLTPPEVLGHYAKDAEELAHYAEIHARIEHDRIERELKFNNAFHDAAMRLYSNEPIIRSFNMTAYTPILK